MQEQILDPGVITLHIGGHRFSFRADSDFAERACQLGEEAERRAALASAEERQKPHEVASFLSYAIDTLIGAGPIETLFGEAVPEILDLLDILNYILDAFHTYRNRRLSRLQEGFA